jgi:AraC-binding-like domain
MSKCTALDRGFEIADGERPFARSGVPLEGNSIASAREIMTSAFMKHRFEVQHNPDFRFRVRSLLMENMSVVTLQYNAQARVVYDAPKEFSFIVLSTGDSFVVDQGGERVTLPQGSLYVVDPELPTVVTLPAHYRQIIVRLDRAALQSYIRNDQGIHTRSRLQFVRSSVDGGGVAAAMCDLSVRRGRRDAMHIAKTRRLRSRKRSSHSFLLLFRIVTPICCLADSTHGARLSNKPSDLFAVTFTTR